MSGSRKRGRGKGGGGFFSLKGVKGGGTKEFELEGEGKRNAQARKRGGRIPIGGNIKKGRKGGGTRGSNNRSHWEEKKIMTQVKRKKHQTLRIKTAGGHVMEEMNGHGNTLQGDKVLFKSGEYG